MAVARAEKICGLPKDQRPSPPAISPETMSAAHKAVLADNVEALQHLLEAHAGGAAAELDSVDEAGNSPLIWACEHGASESVKFLTSASCASLVDLGRRGFLGNTCLQRAARKGRHEIVRVLLEAANTRTEGGAQSLGLIYNDKLQYPLHHVGFHEQISCLEVMLEFGFDTMVEDRKGRTPLEDTKSEKVRELIQGARGQKRARLS